MPTQATLKPASLWPEDFVSGGLLNDEDVEVEDAVYTLEPPPGYSTQRGTPLFTKWSFKVLADGRIEESHMSCGSTAGDNFVPSEDGRFALPTSGRSELPKDSIHHAFMVSLAAKGVPRPLLEKGDLGGLKGLQIHVVRVPTKAVVGGTPAAGERERTHLVCERLIHLPGEKKKGAAGKAKAAPAAAAAAATPAAAPAAAAESDVEIDAVAVRHLKTVLSANGNAMELRLVRAQVFRAMSGSNPEERNAVIKLVVDADWLANQGFLVDDTTVMLAD